MTKAPRVVVVDDSLVSRGVIVAGLRAAGIEVVATAEDGAEAIRRVQEFRPDAVTCDLEMPGMDGFTFLRIVTQKAPVPVIVVSSDGNPDSALLALEIGAQDFVVKPGTTKDGLEGMVDELVAKVVAVTNNTGAYLDGSSGHDENIDVGVQPGLLVIGASTGGPAAVRTILSRFGRAPDIPILITQHMPAGFTKTFATRLAKRTQLDVREAVDGAPVKAGQIVLAPGDRNLRVARKGGELVIDLREPNGTEAHCPSVDNLFESAAAAVGDRLLAVVLTGMGKDGAIGATKVKAAGGVVWAESAKTTVISGMPDSAAAACGGVPRFPIDQLAVRLSAAVKREK